MALSDIQLLSLPAAAEGIAPQLRRFGYVVGPETDTAGCELAVAMIADLANFRFSYARSR